MRKLHSIPGLLAALLISIVAVSGAILALQPTIDLAAGLPAPQARSSVAEVARRVKARHPGIRQIRRKASGAVIASGLDEAGPWIKKINVQTGASLGDHQPSPTFGVIAQFHRSFLLGDGGRAISGVSAGLLVLLCISGTILLVRRCGGWRHLFSPTRGTASENWHVNIARVSIIGLLVSSLSGSYLSMVSFGIVSDGSANEAVYPTGVAGGQPAAIDLLPALKATDLTQLRELTFPYPDDPYDVFAMSTDRGEGYIDQATGTWLSFAPYDLAQKTYELIYMAHTGAGAGWVLALAGVVLGLCALGLPVLSLTGLVIWQKRRSSEGVKIANCPVEQAQVSILFGSEGNSTKGFAMSLQKAISELGQKVHIAPMNDITQSHFEGKYALILTSTYGNGEAPHSASKFLNKLGALKANDQCQISVLGFGDRQFPKFCAFAEQVEKSLAEIGATFAIPMGTIDRGCPQTFSKWSEALGTALALPLSVDYQVKTPELKKFGLMARKTTPGTAPSDLVILRFALPASWGRGVKNFMGSAGQYEVGDLIGIVPPGSATPRYYSLASASQDGYLEICVKRHKEGLCSTYLHNLKPGDAIVGFIKANPAFRPAKGQSPVILIGAGTGIAPLAGFARHNSPQRPMAMYWGARTHSADFIYEELMQFCVKSRRLIRLVTAFSRQPERLYIQDRVREDADDIREMINNGGQVLVCGGTSMAISLRGAMNEILLPLGVSVEMLKQQKRYVEDVY